MKRNLFDYTRLNDEFPQQSDISSNLIVSNTDINSLEVINPPCEQQLEQTGYQQHTQQSEKKEDNHLEEQLITKNTISADQTQLDTKLDINQNIQVQQKDLELASTFQTYQQQIQDSNNNQDQNKRQTRNQDGNLTFCRDCDLFVRDLDHHCP